MIEEQKTVPIELSQLLLKAAEMMKENYRLVQVSCLRKPEHFEINYTFDKALKYVNYRIQVPVNEAVIPSISGVYWCAFTYENEIHDLFGVKVNGINIDFKGTFYRTQIKTPFSSMPNVNIVSVK